MKRLFHPCARHRQDICLLASGALLAAERDAIEQHLAACADCRNYFEELTTVTERLANWEEHYAQLQPSQAARNRWATAVQTECRTESVRRLTPIMAFRNWWQDVIWPCRRTWTGLATVWLFILVGNFALHDHSRTAVTKSASSAAMLMALKDEQAILVELLPDSTGPQDPPRRKLFAPKPRTKTANFLMT